MLPGWVAGSVFVRFSFGLVGCIRLFFLVLCVFFSVLFGSIRVCSVLLGYFWLCLVVFGYIRLRLVTFGYIWLYLASVVFYEFLGVARVGNRFGFNAGLMGDGLVRLYFGCVWLHLVAFGFVRLYLVVWKTVRRRLAKKMGSLVYDFLDVAVVGHRFGLILFPFGLFGCVGCVWFKVVVFSCVLIGCNRLCCTAFSALPP